MGLILSWCCLGFNHRLPCNIGPQIFSRDRLPCTTVVGSVGSNADQSNMGSSRHQIGLSPSPRISVVQSKAVRLAPERDDGALQASSNRIGSHATTLASSSIVHNFFDQTSLAMVSHRSGCKLGSNDAQNGVCRMGPQQKGVGHGSV